MLSRLTGCTGWEVNSTTSVSGIDICGPGPPLHPIQRGPQPFFIEPHPGAPPCTAARGENHGKQVAFTCSERCSEASKTDGTALISAFFKCFRGRQKRTPHIFPVFVCFGVTLRERRGICALGPPKVVHEGLLQWNCQMALKRCLQLRLV